MPEVEGNPAGNAAVGEVSMPATVLRDDNSNEEISCAKSSFLKDLAGEDKAYLIFTQRDCLPCAELISNLSAKDKQVKGSFYLVDVDQCPSVADKFGVKQTPTVVVAEKGQEIARHENVTDLELEDESEQD